jgi:hypothetical protein
MKASGADSHPERSAGPRDGSEWTQVIPNARLCKALIDRITDRANIIETEAESYRFRGTLEKR